MTATTTIRIDYDRAYAIWHDGDKAAEVIQRELKLNDIAADVSFITHIKIDLPTSQLAAAVAFLIKINLIPA